MRFGHQQARFANGLPVSDVLGERERLRSLLKRLRRVVQGQMATPQSAEGLPRVPLVAVFGGERDGAFEIVLRFG